jgi:hypothetical protein
MQDMQNKFVWYAKQNIFEYQYQRSQQKPFVKAEDAKNPCACRKWSRFITLSTHTQPGGYTAGSPLVFLRVMFSSRTHYWAKNFETSAIDWAPKSFSVIVQGKNSAWIVEEKNFPNFFRAKIILKILFAVMVLFLIFTQIIIQICTVTWP